MFGLMRPEKSCSIKTGDDYRYHRMHYCGTCKTLGQQYGHLTRALLNFDTVFFAEILSHLSKENLSDWQGAYQAINQCFTMPDKELNLPLPLKYAAATNVLLGELKLDDNIKDLPGMKWKLARQFYSKSFRKANRQFQEWGIDTAEFWHWIAKQDELEKTAKIDFSSLDALLEYYAEPTAQMTGLIFKKGANILGQVEQEPAMYQLGYQFGRLVYMLDAFKDVEKDIFRNQFNPLARFFEAKKTLQENQFEKVRQLILEHRETVARQIKKLPFSAEIAEHYIMRLNSNIALQIYNERKVPKSLKEQLQISLNTAPERVDQAMLALTSWMRNVNYYLVSLAIFLIPSVLEVVNHAGKGKTHKWAAAFIAALAAIGIGREVIKQRKNRKAKRRIRKAKRKMRFALWLKKIFAKRPSCFEECCNSCCDTCCNSCCESTTDYCCDSIKEGKMWPWIVLAVIFITIILIIVFV